MRTRIPALLRCAFLFATFAGTAIADQRRTDAAQEAAPGTRPESPMDPVFVRAESVSRHAPDVVTRQILQDAAGDIWFASFSGVIRYDGRVYTNITNQIPLAPVRAFSLLRDRHDNIWIGTLGAGAYRYDGASYKQFTTRDGLSSDRVLSLMEDRDGHVWFGHEGGGATRLADREFTAFGAKEGFTDADVSSMAQDGAGRLWFGTRDGLFQFDGESFESLEQTMDQPTGGYIPTLIDGNGQLWFGGGGGLYHLDGAQLRRYSADPVWALELGSDGSIWFAGQSKLQRIEAMPARQTLQAPTWAPFGGSLGSADEVEATIIEAGTLGTMVFDLFEDRDGAIWIGTSGVARLDGDRLRYLGATTQRHDALGRPSSDEAR
jgi:ligand-binding sensor domain-containing protein